MTINVDVGHARELEKLIQDAVAHASTSDADRCRISIDRTGVKLVENWEVGDNE